MNSFNLLPQLDKYINRFNFEKLSAIRIDILDNVAEKIYDELIETDHVKLNFICTHNSRRSQMAQVWAHTAANYFGLNIQAFSGGSESTAFNESAVSAMQNIGFKVISKGTKNPVHFLFFSADKDPIITFSKKYDDPFNPEKDSIAILVCADADENCPFIPQAKIRIPLRYKDPKVGDGTEREALLYDERAKQIGTEIFYMFEQIKINLPT